MDRRQWLPSVHAERPLLGRICATNEGDPSNVSMMIAARETFTMTRGSGFAAYVRLSRHSRVLALLCAALASMVSPVLCQAQDPSRAPWEEYDTLLSGRRLLSPLHLGALGDQVDLQTGGLRFSTTDVEVPGNCQLKVQLARTFTVENRHPDLQNTLLFADWDVDIPRLVGTFATNWPSDRCSGNGVPPTLNVEQHKRVGCAG